MYSIYPSSACYYIHMLIHPINHLGGIFCEQLMLYHHSHLGKNCWGYFPLNVSIELTKLMGHQSSRLPPPVVGPSLDTSPSGR